ncbi:MAG: radical SAM protein [Myxococcales bacterium]|nr:radical SAM protein [Myxococcales bacterium]
MPDLFPRAVVADSAGRIFDHPDLALVCWDGDSLRRPLAVEMIALPKGSDVFVLPGRRPLAVDAGIDELVEVEGDAHTGPLQAAAAFVAPAYLRLLHPAFETAPGAPDLPLYAYTAIGWMNGRFVVPAVRVDADPRQDPYRFDIAAVQRGVRRIRKASPANRALAHIEHCALVYHCRAAQNFFLGRWEAPMPAASTCNAACVGCISDQTGSSFAANHDRIATPAGSDDLIELAVQHLERVPNGVVSFGQGCEGEPLMQPKVLEATVRGIRRRTANGVVNLNSNASLPKVVARLADAGLDSIRISLNSGRAALYTAYYKPRGYTFDHVLQSAVEMSSRGKYVSLNAFMFPGVSDSPVEVDALSQFIDRGGVHLVQLRNLNIDPELYLRVLGPDAVAAPIGMLAMVHELRRRHPNLRFGYFNPARTKMGKAGPLPGAAFGSALETSARAPATPTAAA